MSDFLGSEMFYLFCLFCIFSSDNPFLQQPTFILSFFKIFLTSDSFLVYGFTLCLSLKLANTKEFMEKFPIEVFQTYLQTPTLHCYVYASFLLLLLQQHKTKHINVHVFLCTFTLQ